MSSDEGYQKYLTKSSSKKYTRGRIVSIPKDHPYYRSSNNGRIAVSRLLMAQHLGRNVTDADVVLFKNGNKDDEREENLLYVSKKEFADISTYRLLVSRLSSTSADKLERLNSQISLYKEHINSYNIDPDTLERRRPTNRYWEVDRDVEAYARARRNRPADSEEYDEDKVYEDEGNRRYKEDDLEHRRYSGEE